MYRICIYIEWVLDVPTTPNPQPLVTIPKRGTRFVGLELSTDIINAYSSRQVPLRAS
jgi:hypothetical protein